MARLTLLSLLLALPLVSSWSIDEWAVREGWPKTKEMIRRHVMASNYFMAEPRQADTTQSSLPATTSTLPATKAKRRKCDESREDAEKLIQVPEVLKRIREKQQRVDESEKKRQMEVRRLKEEEEKKRRERKRTEQRNTVEEEVKVEKMRKETVSPTPPPSPTTPSPSSTTSSAPSSSSSIAPLPSTTSIAHYRRVSCDMCLKAFNGLNFNVNKFKKVAEEMVTKDCEALFYGDNDAIGACVDVMLRKIEEYYHRFEPMIETNKVCIQLGMCAKQLLIDNRTH